MDEHRLTGERILPFPSVRCSALWYPLQNTYPSFAIPFLYIRYMRGLCHGENIDDICHDVGVNKVHAMIQELQQLAKDSGHERPLMIGIDQENGTRHPCPDGQEILNGTNVQAWYRHLARPPHTKLALSCAFYLGRYINYSREL